MLEAGLYNISGEKVGIEKLPPHLFGEEVNHELLAQYVYVYQFNQREFHANTKVRGDVRGGGKKPWAQKHTGRARQGSSRSPQWKGGAIVFGPRAVERMPKKLTKKMRQAAMVSALSFRAGKTEIFVLDNCEMPKPSTKQVVAALDQFVKLSSLFIISHDGGNFVKSVRNVSGWEVKPVSAFSVFEVLKHDGLLLTKQALDQLVAMYPAPKKARSSQQTEATEAVVENADITVDEAIVKPKTRRRISSAAATQA